VRSENEPDTERRTWAYDPHLDPQLVWAGKAEHTSFRVPTVSLHVHEQIDPEDDPRRRAMNSLPEKD
jgi:adenine-specific DNA-methyltransferase